MKNQMEPLKKALSSFTDERISFACLIDSSNDSSSDAQYTVGVYVNLNSLHPLDSIEDNDESLNLIKELEKHLKEKLQNEEIKIMILNDASPMIKYNAIEKDSILLMRNRHEFNEFHVRSLSEYYDWQEWIKHHFPEELHELQEK